MSANVTKATVLTLLGPAGASVSKATVLTLVGPKGVAVTKATVLTLIGEDIPDPPASSRAGATTGGVSHASVQRNAKSTDGAITGSSTYIAVTHRVSSTAGAVSGGTYSGLGSKDNTTQTLVGHSLLGSLEDISLRSLVMQSMLTSGQLETLSLVGHSMMSSELMEARNLVSYSLLGPPVFATKVPVKGPPRVVEKPKKAQPGPTQITLPPPPEEWSPEWARNLQERMITELSKLQKAEEANHSVLLRSPSGKVYEVQIDDEGNVKSRYRQG